MGELSHLHQAIALIFLALWVPATGLCLFETAAEVENSDCCPTSAGTEAPVGQELTACCFLGSALFKADGVDAPGLTAFLSAAVEESFGAMASKSAGQVGPRPMATAPPELRVTWQFSTRTALPVRAPSGR